jgi:hypothetical protein
MTHTMSVFIPRLIKNQGNKESDIAKSIQLQTGVNASSFLTELIRITTIYPCQI